MITVNTKLDKDVLQIKNSSISKKYFNIQIWHPSPLKGCLPGDDAITLKKLLLKII